MCDTTQHLRDFYKMRIQQLRREIDDLESQMLNRAYAAALTARDRLELAEVDRRREKLSATTSRCRELHRKDMRAAGLDPRYETASGFPIRLPRLIPY